MSKTIIKHSFSTDAPNAHELAVGEIALRIFKEEAALYTKSLNGDVIELGRGVLNFEDLNDVDLTNVKDGSFLIKQNDKFVASNFIGDIGTLADVEISNPQNGDYLRYNSTYLSFKNFKPSYNLYQLLDVNIPDPTIESNSVGLNNQTLVYDHTSGKFITRVRVNRLDGLDDVQIVTQNKNQLLTYDSDGYWKNMDVHISYDPSPSLGGNLNANGYQIRNSCFRINSVIASTSTVNLNYANGDYWIVNGVSVETQPICIINPVFSVPLNSTAIMMIELRANTGSLLIGGLTNIKYEDGKALQLSGAGKTDLITVTVQNIETTVGSGTGVITTYVTATALNIATEGQGGLPAFRYDKNRYPDVQLFDKPNLYDNYWDYVQLLLNFEPQIATGKNWYADKSINNIPITTTATQVAIPIYTFGIQESVASFSSIANNIIITPSNTISLLGDFTLEMFINHPDDSQYMSVTTLTHTLFSNNDNTLSIKYTGAINTGQDTQLIVKVGVHTYTFSNAFRYFQYQNNRYIHFALVRKASIIYIFVNGVYQNPTINSADNPVTSLSFNTSTISLTGLLNSVRLSTYARYVQNFNVPAMRFGLTGGTKNILERQIFDTYSMVDRGIEIDFFC